MRILHTLPDLHIGGVSNLLLSLLKNFDDEEVEHHLCYFGHNEALLGSFQKTGVRIHKIKHKGFLYTPYTCLKIKDLIKENNIDLVHSHLLLDRMLLGITSFFCNFPLVISIHTTNIPKDHKSHKRRGKLLFEDLLGKITATQFIAVSDTVKNVAIKDRMVNPAKIKTLYSGVKMPKPILRELPINKTINLISVGRLIKSKGFDDLLTIIKKTLTKTSTIKLSILGDGPERENLENLVKKMKLEEYVQFLGFSTKVSEHLMEADIYLSCTKEEGFSISVVEALAHSLPVIAYSLPVFQEISDRGKDFILVEPGNVDKYSEELIELCTNTKLYKENSTKAHLAANSKFNIIKCAKNYLSTYKELAGFNL